MIKPLRLRRQAERPRNRPVFMPEISVGLCRVDGCGVVGDLADELCVGHWDRTLDQGRVAKRRGIL